MDEEKEDILNELFTGKEDLPTLPTIFNEFNALMNSGFVSPRKLATLVKKDQGMVVKIIRLCNVASHGKREEIHDITAAVNYLGQNKLKRVVLKIALSRMFTFGPSEIPDFDPIALWEHSLGTAYFSEILAKNLKLPMSEDFYIGGLMHDVGKKMIYHCYPMEFEEIVFNQINDQMDDREAERDVLGVDHTDIGDFFAKKWKFAPEVLKAVKDHHNIDTVEDDVVTLVVHLANLFAKTAELCFPWDDRSIDIAKSPAWAKILSVAKSDVDPDKLTLLLFDATAEIKAMVKSLLST
ncbi:MAG: HDOD domain-containing protein [bacterium]|nr:HDOD domain-containing protein [bacterium]